VGQKRKIIVTEEGTVDLETHTWDEERFGAALADANRLDKTCAMQISRFMRQAVEELNIHRVTAPVIDEMLKAKLEEYGVPAAAAVPLKKHFFIRNGIKLSSNADTVLRRRYLKKDSQGNVVETPAAMFRRVARHIAASELNYGPPEQAAEYEEIFYRMMTGFRFLPNSPTLMNAGRSLGQLAACFVLPVEDSMEGIFDALKNAAVIHKSGGGTGFSFSRLRPKNSMVGTTGGIASGPVSFMKIFNTATEQVKQGGTRRGANMAILRVDHPDIMEFIHCKADNRSLNNFNISVAVTDQFMEAVAAGGTYDLKDPRNGAEVGRLDARQVYRALVEQAWLNGDPGIVFIDRINRDNPTPSVGQIESTNPCGEQPLLPMEACNLGSVNLAKFVDTGGGKAQIDYPALEETVRNAVRFLDDTIDASRYPLEQITAMVRANRKVGLGVMGFADLLFRLGVPYDSEEALEIAETVMAFIQDQARAASAALAEQRGPFPNWDVSVYKEKGLPPLRNATTTTIAPTGTLSIIAGCSSGIEPLFALSFVRTVMDDDRLVEVNPYFEQALRREELYSRELMDVVAARGSVREIEQLPEDIRRVFVTAHDVAPHWHVRMQAAFQKHTDNAVSKTVNLPRRAGVQQVREIYDLAYELGCKGVTIYRDGSKDNQVLAVPAGDKSGGRPVRLVKERPETLRGFTTKIKTGLGQLYLTVTEHEGRPFEVFATIGKSGRSTTAKTEAIGRLVSLALRSGVEVAEIVDQLKGIGGEHPVFQEGGLVLSIPDAIGRVLEKHYLKPEDRTTGGGHSLAGVKCPECGQPISFEEGCQTCHFCGFTRCG